MRFSTAKVQRAYFVRHLPNQRRRAPKNRPFLEKSKNHRKSADPGRNLAQIEEKATEGGVESGVFGNIDRWGVAGNFAGPGPIPIHFRPAYSPASRSQEPRRGADMGSRDSSGGSAARTL